MADSVGSGHGRADDQDAARVFWSVDYIAPEYAFDTTRKSRLVRDLVVERGIDRVASPDEATVTSTESLIAELHDPDYLDALRTGEPRGLAESQGFRWDEGIWRMALASTSGVVSALELTLADGRAAGSLSSGLHHARTDRGFGYCTINGLAVAVAAVVERLAPGDRVAVFDVDAHCGGGTRALIDELSLAHVLQFDASTNRFDVYDPGDGGHELHVAANADDYMATVERMLHRIIDEGFAAVLYNAGVDAIEMVPRDRLIERERMVAEGLREAGIPCAFVLAGGYTGRSLDADSLADLHTATVEAFIGG